MKKLQKTILALAAFFLMTFPSFSAGKKGTIDGLKKFNVTSETLKDGVWDDKILYSTAGGPNISPQLSWDSVKGAKSYAVFMIDGAWLHMDLFTTETSIEEGALGEKPRGHQFAGPHAPDGVHTYEVYVFALKDEPGKVKFFFNSGSNSIDLIYYDLNKNAAGKEGNVIACGRLKGTFSFEK